MVEAAYRWAARSKLYTMLAAARNQLDDAYAQCIELPAGQCIDIELVDGKQANRLRTRLLQNKPTADRGWSLRTRGPGQFRVFAVEPGTRVDLPAAKPEPPPEAELNRWEKEFFELALKFYSEEDQLSPEEWEKVNDKQLPRLAKLINERRKLEAKVNANLRHLDVAAKIEVIRFLWGERLQEIEDAKSPG
jgi:hypothetical protein